MGMIHMVWVIPFLHSQSYKAAWFIHLMNLLNGDCLELLPTLPDNSIDMVLTDPPYKTISGGQTKIASTFYKNGVWNNDGKIFKENDFNFNPEFFDLIYKKMKDQSHIYWFTNFLNLNKFLTLFNQSKFQMHNLLVWHKGNRGFVNRWYRKNCEYVIFARKGKAFRIYEPSSATLHAFELPKDKKHPTEKPVNLLEMYIRNSSKEGETVLDMFMGSGSTGVACKNLKRDFIGIELDPDYYRIAQERIQSIP